MDTVSASAYCRDDSENGHTYRGRGQLDAYDDPNHTDADLEKLERLPELPSGDLAAYPALRRQPY